MTQKELEAIEEREWPELLGAVARGWCHDANANKVMDEELATAIAKEVMPFVAEAERRGERRAWEEARDIVMDEAVGYTEEALATDGMGEISAEFKSEALRFIQGVFDAKLNALK